jgi:tight adherence protein B
MIMISGVSIFLALFVLVLLAWPGQHVTKSRLGIEREKFSASRSMNALLERHGKRRGLSQALALADIDTDAGQFALRILVVSLLFGVMGLLVHPLLGLLALVLPFFATRAWVSSKGQKRRNRFAEQLPETIQLLIASLRSGFSFSQALDTLADDAEEPARSEFSRVVTETRMGRDLSESLHVLSQRMESGDLEWVVSALDIHRETGGNLAEILENINGTVRERQRIGRKVRTYTAEGRLSAKIMVALPFLLFLLQWRTNPEGFKHFFSGLGLVFLCIAVLLALVGTTWIRKISSIKY